MEKSFNWAHIFRTIREVANISVIQIIICEKQSKSSRAFLLNGSVLHTLEYQLSVSEIKKRDLILSTTLLDFFPIIKTNSLFH